MKALAEKGECYYQPEYDSYYAVYQNMLFAYVSKDNKVHLSEKEINNFDCITLEKTLFDSIADEIQEFNINIGYKLHYDFSYVPMTVDSFKWELVAFDFNDSSHFNQASIMINQGAGDWILPEGVKKISREPVFDSSLWFFAREVESKKLVGIAISTYDSTMKETDIEWFYILPEYHQKGVGRFLLDETIKRSKDRSVDIRVGGTNEF